MNTEQFRVTSIPFQSSNQVIVVGVPLKKDSYKLNSGKYIVSAKLNPERLPILPAMGQHWSITGLRKFEEVESNGFKLKQHVYDNPSHAYCSLPETGEQLISFIANEKDFKGIGESKARALWNELGTDFHRIVHKDTLESRERLRTLLSDNSIDALYDGYAKYANLKACNWMSNHSIPASVQQRLLKHHNEKSIDAIKANPYVLVGFGLSFEDADNLAVTICDRKINDHRRLSAALEISLRKKLADGHTYSTQTDLKPALSKLLNSNELAALAFNAGHIKTQYIINPETGTYHPTAQMLMEKTVSKRLLKLVAQKHQYDEHSNTAYHTAIGELPYELAQKQTEAIVACLDNSVSCITGGAGTGKTTVLRTVLRAFHELGYEIHAVALSGRAAMRLHESIGFVTSTIAKLLKGEPIEPDLASDKHLLVIDEASMIDLPTMFRLALHTHPSVKIIFTGDPDQLPPIGCGKVLSDIVQSKVVPNTMLDIVKRQEGSTGIPEYSKLINQGLVPEKLSTGNIHFHNTPKRLITDVCCELFCESPHNSRVMAPTKALVKEINKQVQESVNEDGERLQFNIHGDDFYLDMRVNDQVLFTQNLYDKGINNGTLGELTSVEQSGESYGVVTLDTGERVEITQGVLDCMELGYAITLHKAQGSQFPRIIIALQKGRIVDRAWLYTAITRAEAEIHIVGAEEDFKAITEAPSNSHKRHSYLRELLKETS
jgi:exodeoxyribonuclease V alpha subunit